MRIEPQPTPRICGDHRLNRIPAHSARPDTFARKADTQAVELSQLNQLRTRLVELTEDRKTLLAIIQQRLRNGYYDSTAAFEEVAQHLVQDLDWLVGLPINETIPSCG